MTKEELFGVIGEVEEEKIAAAGMVMKEPKKSRPAWLRWSAAAVCLCIAVVCAVFFFSGSDGSGTSGPVGEPPLIISQYKGVAASYIAPEPGEYYCFVDVNRAREHYAGQNVKFLLTFDLFKGDDEILSEEEKKTEYQRLTDLGYRLYETEYWTYRGEGEKVFCPVIVGLFTEEELTDFDINPVYGYAFRFVTNGDSSSISVEESDLATEFDRGSVG